MNTAYKLEKGGADEFNWERLRARMVLINAVELRGKRDVT